MNTLYIQHSRRTTRCPNLEMCTFAFQAPFSLLLACFYPASKHTQTAGWSMARACQQLANTLSNVCCVHRFIHHIIHFEGSEKRLSMVTVA